MEEKQLLAPAALVRAVVCSEKPNKKKRKRHLFVIDCLVSCFRFCQWQSSSLVVDCVTSLRLAIISNTFDMVRRPKTRERRYETRSQTADYHLKFNDRDDGSAPRLQLDS